MAVTPLLERSSHERIIESGPHVFRSYRVSASMTYFSIGVPPARDEASPCTMTLKIFFLRTYELRRMAGSLPAPLDEDDVATTPCEEEVLELDFPLREQLSGGKVVQTMREILGHVCLLKNLQLTAEEWDIIMPYDILPQLLLEPRHFVDGIHFDLTLTVDYRLIVNLTTNQH